MNRPQIGQVCNVLILACKTKRGNSTTWERCSTVTSPRLLYYIGYRVVHEGVTKVETRNYGDWELYIPVTETIFHHNCSHIVWMFIESERHNPVYAFPDDVEFEAVTT